MTLSGIKYRDIYSQDSSFIFDINLSKYTSNNFSIGLSGGGGFFGLNFRSGIIYDFQNNLVGAYNGQPITFNSSRNGLISEYSVNRRPINRSIAWTGSFNKIISHVYDSGTVDFTTNLVGNTPSIEFYNVVSNSGISGSIINHGSSSINIFDLYSNDFSGTWNYSTQINSNETGFFSISDAGTWASGEFLNLFIDANYGNNEYLIPVYSEIQQTGTTEDYYFASFALISGNNRIVSGTQNFLYSLPYLTSSSFLSLYFDYVQNRTGDANVLKTGSFTGLYSGWLSATTGFCSGTLYGDSNGTFTENYILDDDNSQEVTFAYPSSIQYSGFPTGSYIHTYNYYESLQNGESVPLPTAFIQQGNYLTDFGGFFKTSGVSGDTYEFLLSQSDYRNDRILTGIISSTSYSGKFVFDSDYYLATGIFKKESPIQSEYTGQLFEGRLYRGMAYCFLPNDYSFLVTGTTVSNYKITGEINSSYNCLLYKDVPNISGSGEYVFEGLITGRMLVKELAYYISGGNFGLEGPENNYGNSGFTVFRHIMLEGMRAYDSSNLNLFSGIENYNSDLMAGLDTFPINFDATGNSINFSKMGFFSHPATKPNGQYYPSYFKYNGDNPENLFATARYERMVETEFSGYLPYPITGYIQRGDFRYYLQSGSLSGFFLEEGLTTYNLPLTQDDKENVNNLYTYTFNGEQTNLIAKKYIMVVNETGISQSIQPPFTGVLESGYFSVSAVSTGESSGIFNNFAKNMQDVWQVSIGNDPDGPFELISTNPFIESDSRYRIENILISGDGEKYVLVNYLAKPYDDISGSGDIAEISFSLNTISGTQVIQ